MRAGIGLLSLLIAAAIIFYISFGGKNGGYEGTVMKQGAKAHDEAGQIAGKTEDNVPIADTIKLEEHDVGGQFRSVTVVSIIPQTPMDTAYGLKAGDEILRVGDWGVSDNNDFGLAEAKVDQAYQENSPLLVLRNGQQLTLTPNTPMTQMNPKLFGKPGTTIVPGGVAAPGQ